MADHSAMRLGKAPPRLDRRTLRLTNYITPALPPAPASVSWSATTTNLGVMLNDKYGCCTYSAGGHMIQTWTAANGKQYVVPDSAILAGYERQGFVPGDPSTDNGAVELDVLNDWRKTGIGGHKILGYVAVDPFNQEHVKQAINLFGGVYTGAALPLSAQSQDEWHVALTDTHGSAARGSWGGHAIPAPDYDERTVTCITWGERKKMTWAWWAAYVDECYAVLSLDWASGARAPSGLALADLQIDLAAVTS